MKRVLTVLAVALVMASMLAVMVAPAFAKIEPVTRNPQGHETQDQGKAQTTTNENPAGQAPPGQNK